MSTPAVLQYHFLIVWDSAGATFLERFPGSPLPCSLGEHLYCAATNERGYDSRALLSQSAELEVQIHRPVALGEKSFCLFQLCWLVCYRVSLYSSG